jgi:hypothetical protein
MDIVEFAEKFMDVELYEWQKEYLRTLDKVYKDRDVRIVVLPRSVGRMYTYFKVNELIQNG